MINRLLFTPVLFAILLFSCSKDKTVATRGNQYFIKAKVNGVEKEFNTRLGATRGIGTRPNGMIITGHSDETGNKVSTIALMLFDSLPVAIKTYVGGVDPVNMGYAPRPDVRGYNWFKGVSVTITELSETEIKGRFSGPVENPSGHQVDISEGSFFVRIY